MSDKFFFKGRKTPKPKHESFGYNTKRAAKLGTQAFPLTLTVTSEARRLEVQALLDTHGLFAKLDLDAKGQEDLLELDAWLNKPKTTSFEKKPNRNEACPCGSGDKYKKCCGQ
ncbi:PBPRA1643 family SWIM/SEC-C metal-binding motif protein [Shewanella salipaludis]|uniref:Zinc chelation protein SecC n=1 Tax=Shewanella salipaludis TaxID=2723052 RepID=A0A972FSC7_9GAMM|nr:PBPRA1643 family SWIM/SEC-C metal-binding motif protein [Shewanella salipaludis]NMH64826.1 zinc chelation protein SecC [Shewanella salipaludis]